MRPVHGIAFIGGLLVALAVAAVLNPFRWIGIGDLSWLWPLVTAAGLAVLVGVCARTAVRRQGPWRWASALAAVALALVALMSTGAGYVVLVLGNDKDTRVAAVSADGRFEIVVHKTSNIIDPVDALYVQTTSGLFSKRAFLGCRNYDSSTPFKSARFTGPNSVLIDAGEQWTLKFDPDTVRAIDTLPDDVCGKSLYTG